MTAGRSVRRYGPIFGPATPKGEVQFVAFGASATALGGLLLSWRYELGVAAGVVVLLFGLHMAGWLPIPLTPCQSGSRRLQALLALTRGAVIHRRGRGLQGWGKILNL